MRDGSACFRCKFLPLGLTYSRRTRRKQEAQRREDAAYAFLASMGFSLVEEDSRGATPQPPGGGGNNTAEGGAGRGWVSLEEAGGLLASEASIVMVPVTRRTVVPPSRLAASSIPTSDPAPDLDPTILACSRASAATPITDPPASSQAPPQLLQPSNLSSCVATPSPATIDRSPFSLNLPSACAAVELTPFLLEGGKPDCQAEAAATAAGQSGGYGSDGGAGSQAGGAADTGHPGDIQRHQSASDSAYGPIKPRIDIEVRGPSRGTLTF